MKKPEKKLKKIHSLRHQITAYFIGLLFLSILTITVINGAFLEKYYVTKKSMYFLISVQRWKIQTLTR